MTGAQEPQDSATGNRSPQVTGKPRIGEPFNPYRRFNGPMIPEALARWSKCAAGAKLVYGCLRRFAGKDGRCFPAIETIASEAGFSEEQARRHIRKLERVRLIRSEARYDGQGQTSNGYLFLWHEIFDGASSKTPPGVSHVTAPPLAGPTAPRVSQMTPERGSEVRGSSERGSVEEARRDLDCRNRKSSDLRPVTQCAQYPHLREALTRYKSGRRAGGEHPSDRLVVEVMDAAGGASEAEVVKALVYLYEKRGLRPGTPNGPEYWAWFPVAIQDYFNQWQKREEAANPTGYEGWEERNETRRQR